MSAFSLGANEKKLCSSTKAAKPTQPFYITQNIILAIQLAKKVPWMLIIKL